MVLGPGCILLNHLTNFTKHQYQGPTIDQLYQQRQGTTGVQTEAFVFRSSDESDVHPVYRASDQQNSRHSKNLGLTLLPRYAMTGL